MRSTKFVLIETFKGTSAPARHRGRVAARHRGRCSAGCEPCPSGQRGGATSVLARAARFFRAVWTKASSYGASHRNAGRGPLAAVDQQIR